MKYGVKLKSDIKKINWYPVFVGKYLKTAIKSYNNKIIANFNGKNSKKNQVRLSVSNSDWFCFQFG